VHAYERVSAEFVPDPTCGMNIGGHLLWPLDPTGRHRTGVAYCATEEDRQQWAVPKILT
jgi:hypothetical protein